MNPTSARLGVHALETRLTPASLAPAALVAAPQAGLVRVAPPAVAHVAAVRVAAPAFNLNIAHLSYNPSRSTSKAIDFRADVSNPGGKVTGTFPVTFYWSDRGGVGGRLQTIGIKSVVLSKTNPAGGTIRAPRPTPPPASLLTSHQRPA